MYTLQDLRKRTEGFECSKNYSTILSNFRCIHKDSPPEDETGCPLLSCAFARKWNYGHILATTCDDGRIIILNTEFEKKDGYPYHIQEVDTDALFSVAWSDVDMKLITTSGNHNATLFDVRENCTLTEINSFKAHKSTVKTACFQPHSADIFATGGRDGIIYIWDCRVNTSTVRSILPDKCILNSHCRMETHSKNVPNRQKTVPRITSLVFQDENKLISCADTDPIIKVWDLRKTYQQYIKKPIPAVELCPKKKSSIGYSHVISNTNGTKLFANSTDNTIYCYNITSYSSSLEYTYTGHHCNSFYVKCCLSPDEQYLASTDSNNKVYIWKINASEYPIVMLDGINEGLSDVSWCPVDELKLATTSDHPSPWIWNALPQYSLDSTSTSSGFAVHLKSASRNRKCKRTASMACKLTKYTDAQTELSKIILPNAVVDGIYQTHTCEKIESKSNSLNDWLTYSHNTQTKEDISIAPKSISKLTVRNRVSPKMEKSPDVQSRTKRLKRKRLSMSPGYNDLKKYFKSSDENYRKM